ncbi:hypothetical protein DVK02_08475 [Halobellus sp. Atlit-31R]|nr:hypothetical protein DVK02_08475 [Halobellus sp. Atlit-31R]
MTRDLRNKARAVFLATLMVVSVFGGTMAFAGSAAAATNSVSLSDTLVSGGEIQVNGSVDANGTVVAFVDDNGDGEFNTSADAADGGDSGISGTEYVSDYTQDGEFSIALDVSTLESGTYDVYVFQEENDGDSYTISNGDTGERSAEIQVDADEPVFGSVTPEAGTTISTQQDIVIPIEDANTSVSSITATVTNSADEEVTLNIDPDSASMDGVDFSNNELTISPGTGSVPTLDDGTYTVDVTAKDEVGNSNNTVFDFTIDSADPTFTLVAPDSANENVTDLSGNTQTEYDLATNYENQTIQVDLSSPSAVNINDSQSSLTVTVEGTDYSETFDYTDDEYTNVSNGGPSFTVNPGESDVPSLPASGDVIVDVSAADEAGNTNETSFLFNVDTTPIEVTNLELTDNEINSSDTGSVDAIVTFNDTVNAGSVDLTTSIDGTSHQITGQGVLVGDTDDQVRIPLNLDGNYGAVENTSAVVNVTAASDVAGNGLANANADASNETFDIDTDGPSVTLSEPTDIDGQIQGYVNVTTFISAQSDVNQQTIAIEVGGQDSDINSEALVDITDSADNVTTQNLPDGEHRLVVSVEDDAGNSAQSDIQFDLNNGQPVTIEQSYLPGLVTPVSAGGDGETDITPNDVFNPDDGADAYYVDGEEVSGDHTITAEVHRGLTEPISAEVGGSNITVDVSFAPLVGAESVSEDEINIGVETTGVEDLDELNVTVEDTDSHFAQTKQKLTRDDFTEYKESGIYTATVDGLDDGAYDVTVTDAEDADGNGVTADFADAKTTSAIVDTGAPSMIDADLTGADENGMSIRLKFDEAVQNPTGFENFHGAAVTSAEASPNDGVINVTVAKEVQTGNDVELVANGVSEVHDNGATDTDTTSTSADVTFEMQLSQGINVVSIPGETGAVNLSDIDQKLQDAGIQNILAYEQRENNPWMNYVPGESSNDLTNMSGGNGYLVVAGQQTTLDVEVENVPDGESFNRNQENLERGWNLVGHFQEGAQPVDQAYATLPSDMSYSVEKGYTGDQVSTLQPGQGYWTFADDTDAVLVPVDYTGLNSDHPQVANVQMSMNTDNGDTDLSTGDTVDLSVDVSDDDLIENVQLTSQNLGIDATLTDDDNNGEYTATGVSVSLTEAATPGETEAMTVTATDADGSIGVGYGESLAVESTAPTVSSITTLDRDTDGNVDAATVQFDEPIDDSTVSADNYTIAGTTVDSVATLGTADDDTVQLRLNDENEIAGTDAKDVAYTAGTTADLAGNALGDVGSADVVESDGADVQVLSAEYTGSNTVELRFSENVGTNSDGSGTIDYNSLNYNDSATGDTAESLASGDVSDNDATITISPSTGTVDSTDVSDGDAIDIVVTLYSNGAEDSEISSQTVDIVDEEDN